VQHRRRRGVVGVVGLALVSGAAWLAVTGGGATAAPGGPDGADRAVPLASVNADGAIEAAAAGVIVHRREAGVYDVTLDVPAALSVSSWSAPATVILTPTTATGWVVTFLADDQPVDVDFTLHASPAG